MIGRSLAVSLLLSGTVAMAASGEPLKNLDTGSYEELAARPNPKQLVIQYIPSLAALLLATEKKNEIALTRNQVEAIRDKASAMAVQPDAAKAVEDRRGYKDIEPHRAWEEWQALRVQFQK